MDGMVQRRRAGLSGSLNRTENPVDELPDNTKKALFGSGHVMATPGAMAVLEVPYDPDGEALVALRVLILVHRHLTGDWGVVDDEDKAANDAAVRDGTRILSAYKINGEKLWVITEADRSTTTILLPEEY